MTFKAAQPTWPFRTVLFGMTKLMGRSEYIQRKIRGLGDVADYTLWLDEHFGTYRIERSRQRLWNLMAKEMRTGSWTVYEFGVAWGYTTQYWMQLDPAPAIAGWHGFDRFTGLPREWRGSKAGEFDAGGNTPQIDDERISWHVGDLEKTLPSVPTGAGQKFLIFDLDIYEPSAFAWNHLRDSLSPGDLLYFDEAFDDDERRLLNEHILADVEVEIIAATPLALGLRVKALHHAVGG